MKKRIISIALSLLTIAIIATGCVNSNNANTGNNGSSENSGDTSEKGEAPTINVCLPTLGNVTDVAKVEDAINAITEDKYNLKIKLTYVEFGNWTQQMNMLLTGNEADIFLAYGTPLVSYVKNGQLLVLDDYYENASSEFKEATEKFLTEDVLKCTTIDGKLYSITNYRNQGDGITLNIDEDIAAEFGMKAGQKVSLEEIGDFFEKAHAKYPEKYAIVPQAPGMMTNAGWSWDSLADIKYLGVLASDDSTEVISLLDNPDFLELISHTRMWYEKGYMMADCLNTTEFSTAMLAQGKAISHFDNGPIYENEELCTKNGFIQVIAVDGFAQTSAVSGLTYAINSNTKNPDASWKMFEVIFSDLEVATLLGCGIENEHYFYNEDGLIAYPEGVDRSTSGYGTLNQNWLYPNMSLAPIWEDRGAKTDIFLDEFNANMKRNKTFGFSFDSSEVVDEYSACSNVMDKYYTALMMGAIDPDEVLDTFRQELEDAGLEKVMEAKRTQLNAWLSENE